VFQRAQQLVAAGNDSAGRAVVDSALTARTEGTPEYADALFWRARLARTAAGAERDYRRIGVEYPLSPRAAESLLLLAQLEMTRRDRAGARAHLARLQREHPTSPFSARASLTLARLAFDDNDLAAGCAAVSAAREAVGPGDVELRNQLDYFRPRCANVAVRDPSAPSPAAADASPPAAADTTTAAPSARREFSVQVAAYETRAAADALAKRLSARGYTARVVGDRTPFRVRIGRYPTRERAADMVRELGRANVRGLVVETEPR
jgi:cell division septation protein DedD